MPTNAPPAERHRRCLVVRGSPTSTEADCLRMIANLPAADVLWVSEERPVQSDTVHCTPPQTRQLLGRSFDCVVIDAHRDLEPNVLAQCHGYIWGGGALVLRLPPIGRWSSESHQRMTILSSPEESLRLRFEARLMPRLPDAVGSVPVVLQPAHHVQMGSSEQAQLVASLQAHLCASTPRCVALLAHRGRGKSAALGLALRPRLNDPHARIAISGAHSDAVREVLRFAHSEDAATDERLRFIPLHKLVYGEASYDIILVDEAAQIPVPMLQRLVQQQPQARLVFATTTQGYEGTGRGFTLRFLEWLAQQPRPVYRLTLDTPIRWSGEDPLEAQLFDWLLLDASIEPVDADFQHTHVAYRHLNRDELIENEALLRSFFGLLVHAHYRTTPNDLRRMLNAPNIALHALVNNAQVVAATMVAHEGALPDNVCEDVAWGRRRLRGHALPETLASHSGRPDAAAMKIIRSVRIAVHPDLRRRGLASQLIEAIHETYAPDFFGTLFGVTQDLLRFRQHLGYSVVRLGASRGSRTGEPSVVMMRPVSERAKHLQNALRGELARELPLQLQLMESGQELELDAALRKTLLHGLPEVPPLPEAARARALATYAFGPRTQESIATVLREFAETHRHAIAQLSSTEAHLITARILDAAPWEAVRARAALPSIPAAMRALRRAFRQLVLKVAPELQTQVTRPP